jgi:hypothetical protein
VVVDAQPAFAQVLAAAMAAIADLLPP